MPDLEKELYAKREKIYPREVHGLFAMLRLVGVIGLLGIYFVGPWILWDGTQAVLFDLPARKFHIFGIVFWPQDLYFLAVLLVIAGLSLFLFTALAGRLWCGYSCPQTVWTEVFLWFEYRIEGSRSRQMHLDQAAMSFNKLWRKAVKHAIWILVSTVTAVTFVGYFTPIRELCVALIQLEAHPWAVFWVFFFTVATYLNAGWMREQVCLYMCPYARFQSAMFDSDTLIISYDPARGEPRGSRRRGTDHHSKGMGDCIDCKMCVQVCPTGIDIRDGLQYQCIGCAACIDACNDIMEKMNYPKNLISYTTENGLKGEKARLIRLRVLIYTSIWVILISAVIFGIATRSLVETDVIRDRNVLYRTTADGTIENAYTLRILNKDSREHSFYVSIDEFDGASLLLDQSQVEVRAGAIVDVTVAVRAELDNTGSKEFKFRVSALDDSNVSATALASFIIP